MGLATKRQWTTESGEKKEDAEFHRIVSWNKLAELCAQLLSKGRKVYVEGRLQTRSWTGKDEVQRVTTEIVISDMIILDSRRAGTQEAPGNFDIPESEIEGETKKDGESMPKENLKAKDKKSPPKKGKKAVKVSNDDEEDMPF